MGISYKNFWSLNTDEAVVIGHLRYRRPKDVEVFIPVNAQMKGIDLLLMNTKDNKKSITVQIKGSRAFEPKKSEVIKYGDGNAGWFMLDHKTIFKSVADYFIFLIYVFEKNKKAGRQIISHHIITIPTKELQGLTGKFKKLGKTKKYNFLFWVNPEKKTSHEFRDIQFDVSEYLDLKGLEKLNKRLV